MMTEKTLLFVRTALQWPGGHFLTMQFRFENRLQVLQVQQNKEFPPPLSLSPPPLICTEKHLL